MAAPRKVSQEALLDTAAKLFAERGYDGTSISDLLKELEVARPTLYTHMRGKQELLDAIRDRLIAAYKTNMPKFVRRSDPPLSRIRGFIELQLEMCRQHHASLVLVSRRTVADPKGHREMRAWWLELDRLLLAAVREAQRAKELTPNVEPRIIAHTIWASLNDLPYWYDPAGRLTPTEFADQLIQLLSGGRA